MKGTWVKAVLMLLVCLLVSAPALADETKWVRGKATAVGGGSITVEVRGKPMTFKFDAKTDVVAPGGGTATRAAQAAGHTGTSLASVVKVGDGVEVHYTEAGGVMMATEIRGGIPVTGGGAMSEEKTNPGRIRLRPASLQSATPSSRSVMLPIRGPTIRKAWPKSARSSAPTPTASSTCGPPRTS